MCHAVLRPRCKHVSVHARENACVWASGYPYICVFMAWPSYVDTSGSNIACFWFSSHNAHLVWQSLVQAVCNRFISPLGLIREEEGQTTCSDIYSSMHMDTAKCNSLVVLARGTDTCRNRLHVSQGTQSQWHRGLGVLWGASASSELLICFSWNQTRTPKGCCMKRVYQIQGSLSCDACFNFTVGCQENN